VEAPSSSPPVLGATGVGRVTTVVRLATYATAAGAGALKEYADGYVSVANRRAWVAFRTIIGACAVHHAALRPEPPKIGVDTEQELLEGW
jgi:hypothetical protein